MHLVSSRKLPQDKYVGIWYASLQNVEALNIKIKPSLVRVV